MPAPPQKVEKNKTKTNKKGLTELPYEPATVFIGIYPREIKTCSHKKVFITQKITSKWMKDLNGRQEAIKIFEEKAGKNLFDFGHSNFLFNTSPEERETKAKMN